MYIIRKKFKFEAAHRLNKSYTKRCTNIHGHRFVVEVFCSSYDVNDDGVVVDFKRLSEYVQPVIDKLDHTLILEIDSKVDTNKKEPNGFKTFYMDDTPTAENLAKLIYDDIKENVGSLVKVRVHETESGWAEYWEG